MNVLFFGPPGAGKGTQSALLVSRKNMEHISTGNLFREAIKNGTLLGKQAKEFLDKGQLVPDSITVGLIQDVFSKLGGKSFILDGFPRNVPQAEALSQLLKETRTHLDKAIFVDVPASDLVARLSGRRVCESCSTVYHVQGQMPKRAEICDKCGGKVSQRSDDREAVIKERLAVYDEKTAPLKDYYQRQGILAEVNGLGSSEEVYGRILKTMN